jgi:NAD(P)-dependent dehydrogenase (short-subunit alcohol dehydrogenase family)
VIEPLREQIEMKRKIDSDTVFLVSGGAKGITAHCVIKMAEKYQSAFILLGRSSIAEPEPEFAAGCTGESALKKRLMEHLVAQGEKPTPLLLQKYFNKIASKRAIELTLSTIKQLGGKAEYISVDVTNLTALQHALEPVVQRLGSVTGIIHGAGNLADKRIEKKTAQDFELVYGPKVKGLENILCCVPEQQLQHLILFSSVVGFYGNAGQTDYALANEILNKYAHFVKKSRPDCHVVSINWGGWDSGMVTPELKKAFAQRNIEMIPIDVGTQMLIDECSTDMPDVVQVVIGSPLTQPPIVLPPELKTARIRRKITLEDNPFLQDHMIGGHPVLPATCAMSWMIAACEQLYPGYVLSCFSDFKILKGIVLDAASAKEYILDLKEVAKDSVHGIEFEAQISNENAEGRIRYNFSARLKLLPKPPASPAYEKACLTPDYIIAGSVKSFYRNSGELSLFHGPTFQGIQRVINVTPEKITTECLWKGAAERTFGQFQISGIFNPAVVDIKLHSNLIWLQHFHKIDALPAYVKSFEQYAPIPAGKSFYVSSEVVSKTQTALTTDIITHDMDGRVYSRMLQSRATIIPIANARKNSVLA